MYLTIDNIHKIIQSHWTHPIWIDNIVIQKDKYIIQLYIKPNHTTLHRLELRRIQNQLLQTYELIINGTINEDVPHVAIKDKKDFVQWIHNQMMYHYPVYF
jgi:hypothetical protein